MTKTIMRTALLTLAFTPFTFGQSFPAGGMSAHLADGGGWATTLLLTNFGTTPNRVRVAFINPGGNPLSLTFSVDGAPAVTDSSREFELKPSQTMRLISSGAGSAVTTGWMNVTGVGGNRPVTGTLIFRQRVAGRPDYEASVPLGYLSKPSHLIQFDNTDSFTTAIAVANGGASGTVVISAWDENGASLGDASVPLAGSNQTAFVLTDRLAATAAKRGYLWIRANGTSLAICGFRFNPTGAFATMNTWN